APHRRVVGPLVFAARPLVDVGVEQAVGGLRRAQQVIDAQALVAIPAPGLIIPEAVAMRLGMEDAERIDQAEVEEGAEAAARFRTAQRVVAPAGGIVDVIVGRHDVVVAGEHERDLAGEQALGMRLEPRHPAKLVGEFLGIDGIAVGQIERADTQVAERRLEVARLLVAGIAGQADQHVARRHLRQQRDAVIGALTDRLGVVAEALQLQGREIRCRALGLLQADDVGLRLLEPGEQDRQPDLDRIDVDGDDLHGRAFSWIGHEKGPPRRALSTASLGAQPTEKELPQPQDEAAFGFFTWKDAPIMSSTKSIWAPLTSSSDTASITSCTPSRSKTRSSSWRWSSKLKPYWKPEQPPPDTARRRKAPGTFSWRCSSATRRAALSLRLTLASGTAPLPSAMALDSPLGTPERAI